MYGIARSVDYARLGLIAQSSCEAEQHHDGQWERPGAARHIPWPHGTCDDKPKAGLGFEIMSVSLGRKITGKCSAG
jgi:hypothetical protein